MTATLCALSVGFGGLFMAIAVADWLLKINAPDAAEQAQHRDSGVKSKHGRKVTPSDDEENCGTESGHDQENERWLSIFEKAKRGTLYFEITSSSKPQPMQSFESLQRHLGSMFVVAAFLDSFSAGIAGNIEMTIGTAAPDAAPVFTHSADAAFPLASVLRVAHNEGSEATVTNEKSLEELLECVRKQFNAVDECDETDATLALGILEYVFERAARAAREALKEVEAGFPTSGGDFAVWKQEQSKEFNK